MKAKRAERSTFATHFVATAKGRSLFCLGSVAMICMVAVRKLGIAVSETRPRAAEVPFEGKVS